MAKPDDTSKPTRSRRNQPKESSTRREATPGAEQQPANTPPTPPLTLEAVIENERIMLLQIRAMLHCLYEVLLYADDDDTILHADVANTAARLINESCARLDSVTLRPLIEAIRSGSGAPSEYGPYLVHQGPPYQVREPMSVYLA
jgi:hypothetical protein